MVLKHARTSLLSTSERTLGDRCVWCTRSHRIGRGRVIGLVIALALLLSTPLVTVRQMLGASAHTASAAPAPPVATASPHPSASPRPTPAPTARAGRLPLAFVPTGGADGLAGRFEIRGRDARLGFDPGGVTLALRAPDPTAAVDRAQGDTRRTSEERARAAGVGRPTDRGRTLPPVGVRVAFQGADGRATVRPGAALPGVVNVLRGPDPAAWRTGLPTYADLTYTGLYPGVDLAYSGADGRLKDTYTVAPGADPAAIRWRYEGARGATVDPADGTLRIALAPPVGAAAAPALAEAAPLAWQERDGKRVPVDVRYRVAPDGAVGFALGDYDRGLPLTIDPTLVYGTYLGGNGDDELGGLAVDAAGNTYVTGATLSTDLPTQAPYQGTKAAGWDAYVTKLNATGTAILFSTYYGGSGDELPSGIAVDAAGNVAIAGTTGSTDLPTQNALAATHGTAQYDAFVAQLTPTGDTLRYATYLGANGEALSEGTQALAVDNTGKLYVVGNTLATTIPTTAGAFQGANAGIRDGFLLKLDPAATGAASLVYGTFLGGSQDDRPQAVAVDATGAATVAGTTYSQNFPTVNAAQAAKSPEGCGATYCAEGFVARLNPAGSALAYSTYLGGNADDYLRGVAVDVAGAAYVAGTTHSADFPTANALQGTKSPDGCGGGCAEGVVAKLAAGGALVYSTFLGGAQDDSLYAIAVDGSGAAYVAGATFSTDFPTAHAVQPTKSPENCGQPLCADAAIAALNPAGTALLYGTYLGGGADDYAYAVAVAGGGATRVAGLTASDDFPTTAGVVKPGDDAGDDVFVATLLAPPLPSPSPSPSPTPGLSTSNTIYSYDGLGRLIGATTGAGTGGTDTPGFALASIAAGWGPREIGEVIMGGLLVLLLLERVFRLARGVRGAILPGMPSSGVARGAARRSCPMPGCAPVAVGRVASVALLDSSCVRSRPGGGTCGGVWVS